MNAWSVVLIPALPPSTLPTPGRGVRTVLLVVALLLGLPGVGALAADSRWTPPEAAADPVVFRSVPGSYADLRERVVLAIEGRGLSPGSAANIAEMLDRTGRDLGITERTFAAAEVIQFCSSVLSREVTAFDPRFVAYCPYAITLYELAAEPGRVWVGYRRTLPPREAPPALRAALERADALLESIVREALE